jgi:hypothetical protein
MVTVLSAVHPYLSFPPSEILLRVAQGGGQVNRGVENSNFDKNFRIMHNLIKLLVKNGINRVRGAMIVRRLCKKTHNHNRENRKLR